MKLSLRSENKAVMRSTCGRGGPGNTRALCVYGLAQCCKTLMVALTVAQYSGS